MTTLETFDSFFDDVMNQKMSVHAFGMYAKGVIMNQQAELEELELNVSEHRRLEAELNQILHPNGDAPKNPSFCDLVAYVQNDLKAKKEVQIIKKGQVFTTKTHGRVVFEGLDFYGGECTAKLKGVDYRGTYYPKLETLPEFQFIDN